VDEITKDIERISGSHRNERSVGGMKTKIAAARISMESGCNMIIANGRAEDIIVRVVEGEEIGTLFSSKAKYSNKERWILFACPRGRINVDAGAQKALREGASLLPCGITSVEGEFRDGDVVRIGDFAKGIANFPSTSMPDLIEQCKAEKSAGQRVANSKVAVDGHNIVIFD
jgi:glutamate 5-kinase